MLIFLPQIQLTIPGSFLPMGWAMGKDVAAVGSVDLDQVHATVVYSTVNGKRGTQRQIVRLVTYPIWKSSSLIVALPRNLWPRG